MWLSIMAYNLNTMTNTRESGTYYAGKNKADQAYGKVLSAQTPMSTPGMVGAGGLTNAASIRQQQNTAALQAKQKAGLQNNPIEQAALAAAESDLQDEMAAENQAQAARTFSFAQQMANRPKTPGGSVRRGADIMSIGQATGSGLAKANMEGRRKARLGAASAQAKLQTAMLQRENQQRLG